MFTKFAVRLLIAFGLLVVLLGSAGSNPLQAAPAPAPSAPTPGPLLAEPLLPSTSTRSEVSGARLSSVASLASVTPTAEELEVLRLVNVERVKAGLWPLAMSPALTQAARNHNAYMQSHNYFGHQGTGEPSPADRAVQAGFLTYGWGGAYVGENIAAGYMTAQDVFTAWMNSDGHRANILRPDYREIGIGYLRAPSGSQYPTYWTQDFGSEPKVLPIFVNDGADQTLGTVVKVTLTDETVSNWGSIDPVQEVEISTDPYFSGATWRPYSQTLWWNFGSTSGSRTLYAKLRDAAKQEVQSSDTVTVKSVDMPYKVFLPMVTRP